jgi:hypothetical protein
MACGFGTADRGEIIDVDKLELEALETPFDGLRRWRLPSMDSRIRSGSAFNPRSNDRSPLP